MALLAAGGAEANIRLFPYQPSLSQSGFASPCGAATDVQGNLYVASFGQNRVAIYSPAGSFITQFTATSPCGLAVDSAGNVYVNSFEGAVVKYKPSSGGFPPTASTTYAPDIAVNGDGRLVAKSNGVAVNPSNQNVYTTASSVNEVQSVTRNNATGGTYRLCKGDAPAPPDPGAVCTAPIAFNASGATVATALTAIYGAGNVSGSGLANATPKALTFRGALAGTAMPLLICDGSALTGGSPAGTCAATRTAAGSPSRISVYQPDGSNVTPLTGLSSAGANFYGIDVYGANGDVYVIDGVSGKAYVFAGSDGSLKRTIDGADTPNGGLGSLSRAYLAVDQSNGHVLVGAIDTHHVVDEFDVSGQYYAQIGPNFGSNLTLQSSSPSDIAVDNGSLSPNQGVVYVTSGGSSPSVYAFGPSFEAPDATGTATSATDVTDSTAVVRGVINDNSSAPTGWRIEYSRDGVSWSLVASGGTEGGGTNVPVSGMVTGLLPGTLYRYRLITNKGSGSNDVSLGEATFVTDAVKPTIVNSGSDSVEDTSARLVGFVNPNSTPTSYRFEWGASSGSYPNRVPMPDAFLGSGPAPVFAAQELTGLQPSTTYHFRLVAISATEGVTLGPDRVFTTTSSECAGLNSDGLASCRRYELVSPADKGPAGGGGESVHQGTELRFQATDDGSEFAYVVGFGLPGSSAGGEVLHRASRGSAGWTSTQLAPPALLASGTRDGGSFSSFFRGLSPDLSCGYLASGQPLAADAPTETTDAGWANFFRRNPDGTYTTITDLAPTSTDFSSSMVPLFEYDLAGASDDCRHVVFATNFEYAGIPTVPTPGLVGGGKRLYEWYDGVLRSVGVVPGPSGPQDVAATPGAASGNNTWNSVSNDGRRVMFTATRATSSNASEIGRQAVFVREDGSTTIDASLSKTATASGDATYQTASRDGRYVFFTARYGLTASSSSGLSTCTATVALNSGTNGAGCDLYRFDVETGDLADLSVDANPADTAGPGVVGVLGASGDGSHVYFAARGELVPGKGKTYSQNLAANTYSVYLAHDGSTQFVGTVRNQDLVSGEAGVLIASSTNAPGFANWQSRVTPDGRFLVFQTAANVTGYDSGGVVEAYHYSADSGTTVCVSCRRDGGPSLGGRPLTTGAEVANPLSPPRTLTVNGRRVFFIKNDRLAPGAVEGQPNLYQWEEGRVSFLAKSPPGYILDLQFAGASANGDDVFFTTAASLVPQDVDDKIDVYNARVGGGFDLPAPSPEPCAALADGCQGPGTGKGVDAPAITDSPTPDGNAVSVRTQVTVGGLSRKARVRAARRGLLSLRVGASRAGTVRVVATARIGSKVRAVGRNTARLAKGRTRAVTLRLSGPARARLRAGHALKVSLAVSLPGARARSTSVLLPGVKS